MLIGLNMADMITGKGIEDITLKDIAKIDTMITAEDNTEKEVMTEDATTGITKTKGKEEIRVLKE